MSRKKKKRAPREPNWQQIRFISKCSHIYIYQGDQFRGVQNKWDVNQRLLECRRSKTEDQVKRALDQIMGKERYINNYRPFWLKNPDTGWNLELDRYYPDMYLGIEINGPQHYYSKRQRERDRQKRELCEKQGVKLLIIDCKKAHAGLMKVLDYIVERKKTGVPRRVVDNQVGPVDSLSMRS